VSLNLSPSSPTSWLEGTSAGILEATTLLALCWERREAVMLVQLATIDEARKWWLRLTSAVSGERHLHAWRGAAAMGLASAGEAAAAALSFHRN